MTAVSLLRGQSVMAAAWKAPWTAFLVMVFTTHALVVQHNASKTSNPVFEVPGDLVLDGTSGCLYTSEGASSDLPVSGESYTIEAWVSPSSNVGNGGIVGWGDRNFNNFNGFRFKSGPGALKNFWWANDIEATFSSLDDGEFHHVAATWDGTTRQIIVDFSVVAQDTPTGNTLTRTNNFCVGSIPGTTNNFIGTIRDLKIWGYARSISQLVQATSTPAPPAATTAGANGDPHLQNIHGERFDLMMPGKHVLVSIPRESGAEDALLRVEAWASKLGGQCEDIYFTELNITGAWAYTKQTGGYHFRAQQDTDGTGKWVTMGKVELKVIQGHTETNTRYLNFFAKHLGRTGFAVGGLLGEEDYSDVSTPPAGCVQRMSLRVIGEDQPDVSTPATAVAVATFE